MTVLAIFQWFNAWNCRSERRSVFSMNFLGNLHLIWATLTVIFLQILAVYNPFMQKILHTTALSFAEVVLVISIALSIIVVEEVRKLIQYRKQTI